MGTLYTLFFLPFFLLFFFELSIPTLIIFYWSVDFPNFQPIYSCKRTNYPLKLIHSPNWCRSQLGEIKKQNEKTENDNMKDIKQYQVPNNLNLTPLILNEYGEKKGKLHLKHLPKYYYLINLYYSLTSKHKDKVFEGYINMNYKQIEAVFNNPEMTRRVINNLKQWNVLEVFKKDGKETYSVDKNFSKAYRLTDTYINSPTILIENTSTKISTNNKKRIMKRELDVLTNLNLPEYKLIRDSLLKIEVDFEGAKKALDKALEERIDLEDKQVKITKGEYSFYVTKKNRVFDESVYNEYLNSLINLNEGNIGFSICKVTNRVYNHVTNLPSFLRPYLRFNNENLIYLDIANSQPYFLISLLLSKNPSSLYTINSPLSPPSPNVLGFSKEVEKYKALIEDGTLYSFLLDCLNKAGLEYNTEKEVKVDLFKNWLYCKPTTQSKYKEVLSSLFPLITEFIDQYKKEDYKKLSIELSRLESKIVINKVCKRVSKEIDNAFCVTIHDGIITTLDQMDSICEIMNEELFIETGVRALVKIDCIQDVVFTTDTDHELEADIQRQDNPNEGLINDLMSLSAELFAATYITFPDRYTDIYKEILGERFEELVTLKESEQRAYLVIMHDSLNN